MVENINLQKIPFPASQTTKIKPLKQKHNHLHDRGFRRHLDEEEDEEQKEERQQHDITKSYKINRSERSDGSENQKDVVQKNSVDRERRKKLIDIVV